MAERVTWTEGGKTWEAPSEDDRRRGGRIEVKGGGSAKTTEMLKAEMMPASMKRGPSADAELSDAEIEAMPEGLGKSVARQKAKQRRAASPQMESLKGMAEKK